MESSCDSDMSKGTRDLVRRGLASDRKRRSSRADFGTDSQSLAPNLDMNASYVRLPPAHVVQAEEPSARGLNLTVLEGVRGLNYNSITLVRCSPAMCGLLCLANTQCSAFNFRIVQSYNTLSCVCELQDRSPWIFDLLVNETSSSF